MVCCFGQVLQREQFESLTFRCSDVQIFRSTTGSWAWHGVNADCGMLPDGGGVEIAGLRSVACGELLPSNKVNKPVS